MSFPRHQHTVLIVDDYADAREALAMILGTQAYEIAVAPSGRDALDQLRGGLRPCLMLLDIHMPDMDGWQVWERMRADPELVHIPVAVLSTDLAQRERARGLGIREFLGKPVDFEQTVAAVERLCPQREA